MARIILTTWVDAPPDRVFDLARGVELHTESLSGTGERAVAGVASGLLAEGDRVTWRARHLRVSWELEVEVSMFDRPRHFRDTQVEGPFRWMRHDHYFSAAEGGTEMRDDFAYEPPLGFLGSLVDHAYLKRYLGNLLDTRNSELKRVAESGEWRRYIP